ncbi:hypothetical protein V1527DRAFT_265040 [Lipomyces starkeyi]
MDRLALMKNHGIRKVFPRLRDAILVINRGDRAYHCIRGTNYLEGGVHQNLIAKFSHFKPSTRFSYHLLHDYVHIHNTTAGHFNRTGTRYYNPVNSKLRNEPHSEHKAQGEIFDTPQDFKGYLNTSYYKIPMNNS